ncbi:MAG TPA: hypothetical protein VK835_03785 [Bacteroidia bacterium]|jgi:hypothetical protein|nr:hypothetical protein [Bacteroidia bacterium]
MIKTALIIISLFLLVSCGQNQAPALPTTTHVALGADSSKTIGQNKKTTDTAFVFNNYTQLPPAVIETFKFAPPIIKNGENDDDDDEEDDDEEEDVKEGK